MQCDVKRACYSSEFATVLAVHSRDARDGLDHGLDRGLDHELDHERDLDHELDHERDLDPFPGDPQAIPV